MADHFFGITDKGKRREKNEDTFFVKEIAGRRYVAACVIDGVGGYNGGDIAASIARAVIMKKLEQASGNIIDALQEAIVAANEKINREKKAGTSNERMACVLTCAVVDSRSNKFWYAHVGDTRLYLLRDGSMIKISSDHSTVGFLEESGRLSEEEAMRHPRRNEINKALGFGEDITTANDFIETGESAFLPGDLLLLCSDGLTDMISSGRIISILNSKKNLSSRSKLLVDAANEAGGNDNITAILVEHNRQLTWKPAPVPPEKKHAGTPAANPVDEFEKKVPTKKTKSGTLALQLLLLAGIMIAALALAYNKTNKPKAIMPASAPTKQDEQLQQLLLHLNDSSKNYALPEKGTVIKLSNPIEINKDSFYLKGNGSVLVADSSTASIIIGTRAKHIVLDSLVFENFNVALLLRNSNVTFRNVRFSNCRIPVQYAVLFRDSLVSGRFKDSIFINQSNHSQ